jgi:hypothetical protein
MGQKTVPVGLDLEAILTDVQKALGQAPAVTGVTDAAAVVEQALQTLAAAKKGA